MIKLKELIKEKCQCGGICCSVTEEVKLELPVKALYTDVCKATA